MMASDKFVVEVKLMDLAEIEDAIYMLRTQRDELLEAAKTMSKFIRTHLVLPLGKLSDAFAAIDKAIAKVEGKDDA